MGACVNQVAAPNRYPIVQTKGGLPPAAGPQAHGICPAATEGKALKQAFQHPRAGRMIIADIGHQLPAWLR